MPAEERSLPGVVVPASLFDGCGTSNVLDLEEDACSDKMNTACRCVESWRLEFDCCKRDSTRSASEENLCSGGDAWRCKFTSWSLINGVCRCNVQQQGQEERAVAVGVECREACSKQATQKLEEHAASSTVVLWSPWVVDEETHCHLFVADGAKEQLPMGWSHENHYSIGVVPVLL